MIYATTGVGDYEVAGLGTSQAGAIVAAGGQVAGPAIAAAAAIPVLGPAIAGATLVIGMWLNRKGPKQKVATTEIVNEAEPFLRQNLDAFNVSPHSSLDKQQALDNFDGIWSMVVQKCSDPSNGQPGINCVNDRKRGSTKGYDWFVLYRDPIAQAEVHDTPLTQVETGFNELLQGNFSSLDKFASGLDVKSMILPLVLIGGIWYLSNKV
jgi:hypothetical protein